MATFTPGASFTLAFENEEYSGIGLTDVEETLLQSQLYGILGAGSSLLHQLFQDNYLRIIAAAGVAKGYFQTPFKGLGAGDSEFGFQLIRPWHVLRSTAGTETPVATWQFTFTAGTGQVWIGYGSGNTTAINIDKRLLCLPMAVSFSQGWGPIVEEISLQVGSTTYPIVVVRNAWLADNVNQVRWARIRPQMWIPKQTVLGQVTAFQAGINQLQVQGISFARGDLLRNTNPTTVQT